MRHQTHKKEYETSANLATKAFYSYVDDQKSKNSKCCCYFCNTTVEYTENGYPQSLVGYVICDDCSKPFYHGDFRERMCFLKNISMDKYLIYRSMIKFIHDNKLFLNSTIVPKIFIMG